MGDDSLNNPAHQVLSDYTLLEVKSCDDIQFSLDHPLPYKMNLCAISQLYPTKYFIAVNNEIRIYGLSGGHVFTRQPIMILKPSANPGFLINSIKVGPMMLTPAHYHNTTEILAVVGDNGEVFAWDTQQLFSTTKSTEGNNEKQRKQPFLRKVNMELAENETSGGVSTWGIALHVHGLLAVSANNYRITIYNLLEKRQKRLRKPSAEQVSNYLGDRELVELAGHLYNIPCIDFDSTGRYLASGSIDMTCRLWDLSTLQQIGKRSMTRSHDGDTWLWCVKFISPGNFKHAKCDNLSLSNTIRRKVDNGRSTSVSDLHLLHSAPYPVYQLDMGQMFSRLNTEEHSDDDSDYEIGATIGGGVLNQHVVGLNDGNDDWNEQPTDITRLISLSNFLSRHLQQQPSQTEVGDILLENNETGVLGFELEGGLLDPSPDNHLLHQYEEDEDGFDNGENGIDNPSRTTWNDDDDDDIDTSNNNNDGTHFNGLYDAYNDEEERHQEWSDFEDQTSQGFSDNIDDDLDDLFEHPTPEQQLLEDQEDANLLDWEDRYISSMGGGANDHDDLESITSMGQSDNGTYDHWQEQEHEPSWHDNDWADNNDITDNLSDLNNNHTSQPVDAWGIPRMNQRENYEELMLEEGSWMEDRNMFPWHWTAVRASNEQDRNASYDHEEELAQYQPSDVTRDQHQNSVPAWTTKGQAYENDGSKSNLATIRGIKSRNPTVLSPPLTCLSISGDDHNSKIPFIFEPTESSNDTNKSTCNEDDILQDYLIMTTKKDAYLLKVSHEPSLSLSSSSWPASTMNDPFGGHTMTTIQRERHVVSRADSRTEERLNIMERLNFVEWIPELELCVMASQKGCVALTRILQVQLTTGSANSDSQSPQTCLFNHEKYLPLHGLQNSVLYGMTVHRLPSADDSRGFSFPVYQLLLLYLDGTMRSYLISKNQPQVSSSHSLSDLYCSL